MILPQWLWAVCLTVFVAGRGAMGLQLKADDEDSIKEAAATTAYNMMSQYSGNETGQVPGKLGGTWWEGGAMFMTLIQYWYWTGDDSYNGPVSQGMYWQKGNDDYFPSNYSNYLGNDDQVFWGLAAMTAAELNYPEDEGEPSWLSLAQGVFNTQVPRWDTTACGGGLRWQIYPYQEGYGTKNSVSNGGLFQLAARLARYTNNETYSEWADKIWDWSSKSPLVQPDRWFVADTTDLDTNCKNAGNLQWTYNYGMYLSGSAYMYNLTDGDGKWKHRVDGLLKSVEKTFFPKTHGSNILSEVACEPNMKCDRNQDCFKGFLAAWLTFMTTIAPYTSDRIIPKIQASAEAAAKQCSGGKSGSACGRRWYQPKWDGSTSLESDMSALSIMSSAMIAHRKTSDGGKGGNGPFTSDSGGKSKGDPHAGTGSTNDGSDDKLEPITTGDKAGAGILTAVFAGGWVGAVAWLLYGL